LNESPEEEVFFMSGEATATQAPSKRLSLDFWKYWTGETISNLGSSFTQFALPLLVFQLTGSALNLAISTAANFVPYLLFGLLIGAWTDRVNRKRMMIIVDVLQALSIASIPAMYFAGLPKIGLVWWIYGAGFVSSTLNIFFTSGEFAAIPSLVDQSDLVTANGRIQASFAGATIVGPLLAGALLNVVDLPALLFIDASSFLVSACTLSLIRRSFNAEEQREKKNIFREVVEGLRYVLHHPVLRNISAMMALVNFFAATSFTQLVLFATVKYGATGSQISLLFAAGSAGTVVLSLLAGPLRKRWSFSRVALSALAVEGLLTVALAFTPWYYVAVLVWAITQGVGILFNINTGSLRQAIVPSQMLGRVISIAGVLAWSAIPLGALLGGGIIQAIGKAQVGLVYAGIGVLTFGITLCFSFTALGHAERYLPKKDEQAEESAPAESAAEAEVAGD
jgi:MFS family permease